MEGKNAFIAVHLLDKQLATYCLCSRLIQLFWSKGLPKEYSVLARLARVVKSSTG